MFFMRSVGEFGFLMAMLSFCSVAAAQSPGRENPSGPSYSLSIQGMTSETSATHLQQVLSSVRGVSKATVDYKTGGAWVSTIAMGSGNRMSLGSQLASAVKTAGYRPTVNYVLRVRGMTCEACGQHIQQSFAKVPGVLASVVDFKGGYAVVQPDAKAGDLSRSLMDAVEAVGYKPMLESKP